MKRNVFRIAVVGVMLSCGVNAGAQSSLSNILSKVKSSTSSSSDTESSTSSSSSSVLSAISSIFSSSSQATESKITGTWTYSEPAIVFESDNILSSAAGEAAATKIEEKLASAIEKCGITEDMTVTFSSDGSFSSKISSKTVSGTWEISDSKLNLTCSGKTVSVTTQMSGSSTLMLVVDATKLLTLVQTIGSSASSASSTLSTISSLASSVDGMEVGLKFTK